MGVRLMFILGLTGSIGMGKSTAAGMFRRLGVPVHDADAEVHRLLGPGGGAVAEVAAAFPGVEKHNAIDRRALGAQVFDDPDALRRLEAILHPRVRAATERWLKIQRRRRQPLVVLDIPLLYETDGAGRCDAVAVVSAPAMVQRARVLRRPGMTPERYEDILAQQVPDVDKRFLADFVIHTGLGKNHTLRRIRQIVRLLKAGS